MISPYLESVDMRTYDCIKLSQPLLSNELKYASIDPKSGKFSG